MAKKQSAPEDFLAAVGEKIRYYRKKKGHTLNSLGEGIELDKSNMHHIESGKNITILTLQKIALFLDVEPGKLVSGLSLSKKPAAKKAKAKTSRKPAKKKKR